MSMNEKLSSFDRDPTNGGVRTGMLTFHSFQTRKSRKSMKEEHFTVSFVILAAIALLVFF